MNVLFVCLGNICRSPLGEGILKNICDHTGLDWNIDSAGTGGWHAGESPDHRSIKVAAKHGIDIHQQRARQFKQDDFDKFDHIISMDKSNFKDLTSLTSDPNHLAKISLMMDFDTASTFRDVPDPYYDNRFDLVFELVTNACNGFVQKFAEVPISL